MNLTKQDIEKVRLTCVNNRYYQAQQVDALLDDIADAADKLQQELGSLRETGGMDPEEKQELTRLRKYEGYARDEIQRLRAQVEANDRAAFDSSTMLRVADQQARDMLERARLERTAIINEAIDKRERVNAANRASYYAALQFKQDIQRQMDELETQLSAALGALTSAASFQERISDREHTTTASEVNEAVSKEDSIEP